MAKFNVTFYYHTNVTVEVEAENEQEALSNAQMEVENEKYNQVLLDGLQTDSAPDIELTDETPQTMEKGGTYAVTIEWVNDRGKSGSEHKTFDSLEKAREYMNSQYKKDLANYQRWFGDDCCLRVNGNTLTIYERGNYHENHIIYTLIK